MPIYTLKNKKTNEVSEHYLSYDDLKKILEKGEYVQVFKPLNITGERRDIFSRTNDTFNEKMKSLKDFYKGSTIKHR